MGVIDALTAKALEKGSNSAELSAAAQRHANSTWFYLIAAAIVWYFFGWGWALIPLAFAAFKILQSVSATLIATRLKTLGL